MNNEKRKKRNYTLYICMCRKPTRKVGKERVKSCLTTL